jgi:hypothetical protein
MYKEKTAASYDSNGKFNGYSRQVYPLRLLITAEVLWGTSGR